MQAIAELSDAADHGSARQRLADRTKILTADLDHRVADLAHQRERLALGDETPTIEDREPVAALSFVHVMRRH